MIQKKNSEVLMTSLQSSFIFLYPNSLHHIYFVQTKFHRISFLRFKDGDCFELIMRTASSPNKLQNALNFSSRNYSKSPKKAWDHSSGSSVKEKIVPGIVFLL